MTHASAVQRPVSLPLLASLLSLSFSAFSTSAHAERIYVPGGGGAYNTGTKTFLDSKFRGVYRQKYDYSCGSAALATLLTYHYGMNISEMDILQAMYAQGDQEKIRKEGFSLLDMKNYLSSIGLQSAGYRESLDKLTKAGIPAIVLINRRGYMHFVVVKGVTKDEVLIGDSATGLRVYSRKEFEPMWNNILFVVTDKMNIARASFNDADAWGKKRFIASSLPLTDMDLAQYTLSTAFTPNYY